MKYLKKVALCLFFCCIPILGSTQSILVDDSKNAVSLTNILTNNSSCINTSGEIVIGDNFTPGQNSYGYFNNQRGRFPFTEGIVLSTWSSVYSVGPFIRNQGAGSTSWFGDSDLDRALGITSINATILEFDFIPLTNFISFNYLFASNEYQDDFPCRFSDGFAFLIKEKRSTDNYKNLAVIPLTSTPVSSTNIHPAISFTDSFGTTKSCPAINESYFGQLNTSLTNSSPINYAGQTQVLTAQTNVTAGTLYHIKLVIADDEVKDYDSAVFIQAGSFVSKIDLGSDRLLATNNAICFGDTYVIDPKLPASYKYTWSKDEIEISGQNNPTLIVNDPENYSVVVSLASGCTATGKLKVEYNPKLDLVDTTLKNCVANTSGQASFDLTRADSMLLNGVSDLGAVTYFETLNIATNILSDPIANPSNYFYVPDSNTKIVYGKLTDSNGCSDFAKVTLEPTFYSSPVSIIFSGTIVNDFDGVGNSITINYPGITNEYKLVDFISGAIIYDFQTDAIFSNVLPGLYTAFVRDTSTCNQVVNSTSIYVLDYPRYFTPNGDGYNDLWNIENLDLLPQSKITIFNRYGKLLKEISTKSLGWNGTFNGSELPAADYWFNLTFEDGKVIKGHFSLKR